MVATPPNGARRGITGAIPGSSRHPHPRRLPPPGCGRMVAVFTRQLGTAPTQSYATHPRRRTARCGRREARRTPTDGTSCTTTTPAKLVHIHPDDDLAGYSIRRLPIRADMSEFCEMADDWQDPDWSEISRRVTREPSPTMREWLEWSDPKPRDGMSALDTGPRSTSRRRDAPPPTRHLQRARQFLGWWRPLWPLARSRPS